MKAIRLPRNPPLLPGTQDWEGALIFIRPERGEVFCRPAAFVFDLKSGLAWVEPSYADPYGAASPALRFRFGSRTTPTSFDCSHERVTAERYRPGQDYDLVGDSLAWFHRWVFTDGRTYESERARMWKLIREDAREAIQSYLKHIADGNRRPD